MIRETYSLNTSGKSESKMISFPIKGPQFVYVPQHDQDKIKLYPKFEDLVWSNAFEIKDTLVLKWGYAVYQKSDGDTPECVAYYYDTSD